jgi:hypothetical protein
MRTRDGVERVATHFVGHGVAETPAEYVVVRPTVYLDTTIPSYLTAWPSRDAERVRKQRVTQECWNLYRWQFDVCTSELVREEAGAGDPKANADAQHVAVAATHSLKFLLTWNYKHLANDVLRPKMMHICRNAGYTCPQIVTPDEIMRLRTHV